MPYINPRKNSVVHLFDLDPIAICHHFIKKPERGSKTGVKVTSNQLDYLQKVVKEAMTLPCSECFKMPVNFNALQIPDYPNIIQLRMDLGTIQKYLKRTCYSNAHECLCDLNQMFTNCYIYNRCTDPIVSLAFELETFFRSKLEALPYPEIIRPAPPKRGASASTTKRPMAGPGHPTAGKVQRTDPPELLRQCENVLKELQSRRCQHLSEPFLEPVDVKKFNCTDYYDVVKQPMDIATMMTKITANKYRDHTEFNADFHLIINNCILYNGKLSHYGKQAEKLLHMYQDLYKRFVLDLAAKLHLPTNTTVTTTSGIAQQPIITQLLPPSSNVIQRTSSESNRSFPLPSTLPKNVSSSSLNIPLQSVSSPLSNHTQTSRHSHQVSSVNTISLSVNVNVPISSSSQSAPVQPSLPRVSSTVPVSSTSVSSFKPINVPPAAPLPPISVTSSHEPVAISSNRDAFQITSDEKQEVDRLFMDVANMAEKSLELATLLEDIQSRIYRFCTRRSINFSTLQKLLSLSNKERLPDFFIRPTDPEYGSSFHSATYPKPQTSLVPVKSSSSSSVIATNRDSNICNGLPLQLATASRHEVVIKKEERVKKVKNKEEKHSTSSVHRSSHRPNGLQAIPPTIVHPVKEIPSSHKTTGGKSHQPLIEPVTSSHPPKSSKPKQKHSKKKTAMDAQSATSSTVSTSKNSYPKGLPSEPVSTNVIPSQVANMKYPPVPPPQLDEVSYEEKALLSNHINGLPHRCLNDILDIIQRFEHSPPSYPETHEIEIDFDQLQSTTLRALQSYVAKVRREEEFYQQQQHAQMELARQRATMMGNASKGSDSRGYLQGMETIESRLQNIAEYAENYGKSGPQQINFSSGSDSDSDTSSGSSESSS